MGNLYAMRLTENQVHRRVLSDMKQITLRVQPETKESLKGEAEEHQQTLSDYMRDLIRERTEDTIDASEYEKLQAEHEELRNEYDSLQTENERLHKRIEALIAQREEHRELVEYVEEEQSLQERTRGASAFQRFAWWLVGDPAYRGQDE